MEQHRGSRIVIKRDRISGSVSITSGAPACEIIPQTLSDRNLVPFRISSLSNLNFSSSDIMRATAPLDFDEFQQHMTIMSQFIPDQQKMLRMWRLFSQNYWVSFRRHQKEPEKVEFNDQYQPWGFAAQCEFLKEAGYLVYSTAIKSTAGRAEFSLAPKGIDVARSVAFYLTDAIIVSRQQLDRHLENSNLSQFVSARSRSVEDSGLLMQNPSYIDHPNPDQISSVITVGNPAKPCRFLNMDYSSKEVLGAVYSEFQHNFIEKPTRQLSNPLFVEGVNPLDPYGSTRIGWNLLTYVLKEDGCLLKVRIASELYRDWQHRFGRIRLRVLDRDIRNRKLDRIWAAIESDGLLRGFARLDVSCIDETSVSSALHDMQSLQQLKYLGQTVFAQRPDFTE